MQSTDQPVKFILPFAQNDGAKVDPPVTTSDATRFSQSLGSPPLTGVPPEAGGVPPQLEDFNGALNQISRGVWWALGGNRFFYDNTWATNPLINGYARGAVLPAALGAGTIGMGEWINNVDDNTANPDTTGTGWLPGYHYGTTALTGQAGGTVVLTPVQAGKKTLTIAGTLTSNLVLVVPDWVYDWAFYNNTSGAFTVTVKNAATPSVLIPQNGAPTPVHCDGATCTVLAPNIGVATSPTQAMQLGQASGRLLNVQKFTSSGTYTPTAGAVTYEVEMVGGGGGGGGAQTVAGGQVSAGAGGGAGAYCYKRGLVSAVAGTPVTVGAGGATASAGTASTFAGASAGGGSGGTVGIPQSSSGASAIGGGPGGVAAGADINGRGGHGLYALYSAAPVSGTGGASQFGGGADGIGGGAGPGNAATTPGSGGGGAALVGAASAANGGAGAAGLVMIREYS